MNHITVQQFIEAWEKSASVTEVAQKTRLTKATVQAKATQLRKLGIPLKKFAEPGTASTWNRPWRAWRRSAARRWPC